MTAQPFSITELEVNGPGGIIYCTTPTTNGTATVTIAGDGTGKPSLNLTNAAQSASLEVTTNNEMTIAGALNNFKFDVSSATGGITWPDGTTQITASAAGTSFVPFLQYGDLATSGWTNLVLGSEFMTETHQQCRMTNNATFFQPFYAPVSAQYDTLKMMGTVYATGSNVRLAIWSVDANDMPDAILEGSSCDIAWTINTVTDNGGVWNTVNTVDAAGTAPTLVRGTPYYMSYTGDGTFVTLAGRISVAPTFLDNTAGNWYTGSTDPTLQSPSNVIKYLNADSGASAGDLCTTVSITDMLTAAHASGIMGMAVIAYAV